LNSVTSAICSVFIFKIVDSCVDQGVGESKHAYNERLTYLLGFALLWNGIGRCLFSFLTKKIADYMNCFQFCYFSALCCVASIIFGTASYCLSSLILCCIFTFLIGVSYATTRNSCNLLLKEVFKNDLDLIGINYFVSSMSFIANVVVITVLTKISISLCLLAYFAITIYCAYCTRKLPFTKGKRLNS
jgi:xanthine/uracil permease